MVTNKTSQPKRQNKEKKIFESHIPGIGQSKTRKDSRRSMSQVLWHLNCNNNLQSNKRSSIYSKPSSQAHCSLSDPPYISTTNNRQTKKQLLLHHCVPLIPNNPRIGQTNNQQTIQQSTSSSLSSPTRLDHSIPVYEKRIKYGLHTYSIKNIPSPYVLCCKN